jgi:hypothetical protein
MQDPRNTTDALRAGIRGALLTLIGVPLSGPVGLWIVTVVAPSPGWTDVRSYVRDYHPIETFPFFCGFALVLGYVVTIVALHRVAPEERRTRTLLSVVFATIFATLIVFNYICQTTFVPALVRDYRTEYDPIITAFSMSNPHSLAWSVEMWGYAFLGLATWLAAPVLDRTRLERTTALLMVANGVVSIGSALVTAIDLQWVLTPTGLASYLLWNLLVFALSICLLVALRRRLAQARPAIA